VYACPQCDRRFAKKPSLVAHLVRHARDAGRLGCVQCGLACSDAGQLELHRRQQHADAAKFCCRKCGRTFQRQQQYDLHIEVGLVFFQKELKMRLASTPGHRATATTSASTAAKTLPNSNR